MKKIIAALLSVSLFVAPFAFAEEATQATDQTSVTANSDTATPAKKKDCNCCKGKHTKHHKKTTKTQQSAGATEQPAATDQPAAQ
jgi:hypothetical protein